MYFTSIVYIIMHYHIMYIINNLFFGLIWLPSSIVLMDKLPFQG